MDKYFSELAVYRIEREEYFRQQDKKLKNDYEVMTCGCGKNNQYTYEEFLKKNGGWLTKQDGGGWRYNEIIGFIRLYFSGSHILGEYFQTDTQRIVKTRKKQFIYKTYKLVPEMDVWNKTDEEIYETICDYISECKKELKNRYIDTTNFKCIGQYVKWNKLLRDENHCIY